MNKLIKQIAQNSSSLNEFANQLKSKIGASIPTSSDKSYNLHWSNVAVGMKEYVGGSTFSVGNLGNCSSCGGYNYAVTLNDIAINMEIIGCKVKVNQTDI